MSQMPPTPNPNSEPQRIRVRLPLAHPRWVYIFLIINVVLFVAMLAASLFQSGSVQEVFQRLGVALSGDSAMLIRFGANYAPAIDQHEYWRLLTANFLHVGLVHLLFNMYALYGLGMQVESIYGPRRFVAIYILTGISGAVFSYLFTHGLSAGASTSLFGLFGALVVFFYRQRKVLGSVGQQQLISLGVTLAINVFLGLSPGSRIDNWGHAGGFIGGLILAWFLCPHYEKTNPFLHAFQPVLKAHHRPELSNEDLTDTNTLAANSFVMGVFVAGLIVLTALGSALR